MSAGFVVYKLLRRLAHNSKVRILFASLIILAFIVLYRYVLNFNCAKIITLQEIPSQLVPVPHNLEFGSDVKQLCDIMPTVGLVNRSWSFSNVTITEEYLKTLAMQLKVKPGGSWKPLTCVSQHHVAIVIPYRDRQSQLNSFLAYMHPFLQYQCLNYQIFIVEQSHQRPFNRAKLFNIGYKEAEKLSSFHCYIFHDVDLIPQNIHNIYGCTKLPRHLSANIDVFNYKVPYDWIFGGAAAILKSQFESVNGFSNKFFGWGGEDDDFFNRVTRNGSTICRFEASISRYIMLAHKKELPNEDRYYYLLTGTNRFESDGLNSLKYTVNSLDFKPLYTRIVVDL